MTRPRIALLLLGAEGGDVGPAWDERTRAAVLGAGLDDLVASATSCGDVEIWTTTDRDVPQVPVRRVEPLAADEQLGLVLADDVERPLLCVRADLAPHAGAPRIADAVDSLGGPWGDAVIGLTVNGPWWALGLQRPDPHAVLGVPQEGAESGGFQLDRLHALGLALGMLDRLVAVERPDDARLVAASDPGSPFAGALGL